MWKQEFIKDARYMEGLYKDKAEFRKDYAAAREEHKYLRIMRIRGDTSSDTSEQKVFPKK